ncbi:AAA family ATPase [Solwaraspora sp. WMMA2056]|uniref:HelD family protein n=1 Tax=Solwaraspora sp. WMMA2056 TaxID=3015161 RepID=UPI00259B9566|nr:AAA family ATPase [Solwaraspora sp. WMMA2056]WJK41967.1 AAA family ATPase [Solwaraspora sp. WMMA2056]
MPVPDLDTELATERAHLAASRAALQRMRQRAETLFAAGDTVAGDAYTAETLGRHLSRRVAELADDPHTPLFFGRLDFGPADDATAPTDQATAPTDQITGRHHIGRRHVADDAGEPLVLDWRAPVSRAFYQASAADPQQVRVRRRFGYVGGDITGFEDEHLDRGEELGTSSRILTTEIERPRVGPMRDIVATIQPEQDALVRADLGTSICVQGAPGTGKTAVGLHRAAYLLYAYRERLRRAGVLIIGPNRAFLAYIANVLPALGEVEVAQCTIADLIDAVPVRGVDDPAVAALKHDPRMAEVLRRAVAAYLGEPQEPITVADGSYRWRIGAEALHRVVATVRAENPPYLLGRERVLARVVALLQRQAETRRAESPSDAWLRRMARVAPVRGFLDQVWPAPTAPQVVAALLTDARRLADAATGVLDDAEQAALIRPAARSLGSVRWTDADLVLIDEVAGLLHRPAGFGHVIVDEAQDLSPMQCRVIARRSEHGSITLLGDLAQGTAVWAATDWRDALTHLGRPQTRVVPLSVGFRVPAVVVALANRLLPALGVDVPPGVSLRRDGSLSVRTVADLATATVAEVRAALTHDGSVGVIAARDTTAGLRDALAAAGVATTDVDDPDPAVRVTVVAATDVKGLEYDHVIVVEPAQIVAAEPRGLHRLYVVLTRAVSRLVVLHSAPLPDALADD